MFVINFGYVIMMFSHHTILIPYLPALPTVRRVNFTNNFFLVAVVQSMKSHAAANFVLGGVAWIRWVGWDDQIITGRR